MAVAPNKLVGIIGPFKVLGYDEKTRSINLDKHPPITLKSSVKDNPRIGYNYAFKMAGAKEATEIYLCFYKVLTFFYLCLAFRNFGQPYMILNQN